MNTGLIKTSVKAAFLLVLVVLSTGCIKEEFNSENFDPSLNLTPGLAIPIGFSHMGFEEYLSENPLRDELQISDDGFMSLYYPADIDSGIMADLLSIADANITKSILNQTGSVVFLNTPGATFDMADSIIIPVTIPQVDARIDSIKLLSGTLQLTIIATSLTGTITYQVNGLRQNGIPFTATRNLMNPDLTLSIANYTIIPEHDIAGNNLLKCKILIHLESPSGPVNPGGIIMDAGADLTAIRYETIYGDMGGYSINFPAQTIATPFFNLITEGQIRFADPRLKLRFSNSVGVPFGISFSQIYAIDRNNVHHPLTGPGIPTATNPKIINYPSLSQAGETIKDSLIIDSGNSNLPDFIATNPDSVTIKGAASVISLTPPATTFISYDSKYKVSAVFELPLWGKADFIILLDTMDFDYASFELPQPEEIEKLIIRTSIINSFPASAWPQVYLLDENYIMLDSLFTGTEKIEGASDTNGDGKADPQNMPPIDIDLPRSRMDNLQNTRYLRAKARIATTDFPALDVKLYSSYFIDFKVGIIAQLKINTGDL